MYNLDLDVIGTHLSIRVESSSSVSIEEDFLHIEQRLKDFDQKYSRFIPGNWLHHLNIHRKGILDTDASKMLSFALEVARKTDGYFDPTIGKRLRNLGYGNQDTEVHMNENIFEEIFTETLHKEVGNYTDIVLGDMGNEVFLRKDIELEFGGVGK